MATVKCSECSGKVSATLTACPHCGLVMSSGGARQFLYLFLRCFVAVCVGTVLVFWLMPLRFIVEFHQGQGAALESKPLQAENEALVRQAAKLGAERGATIQSLAEARTANSAKDKEIAALKLKLDAKRGATIQSLAEARAANYAKDKEIEALELKLKVSAANASLPEATSKLFKKPSSQAEKLEPAKNFAPVWEVDERFVVLEHNDQGYLEYRHKQTGMVFVALPGGKFSMGSPANEAAGNSDEERHIVFLTRFLIAKYEVTQAQWLKIMNTSFSRFSGDNRPVERATSKEIDSFLSRSGLMLPTEAQWEYACRAGSTGSYSGKHLDSLGWFQGNAGSTHVVGLKAPNQFGLYDMHGNVWERCRDTYSSNFYSSSSSQDPVNLGFGESESSLLGQVIRGGSWKSAPGHCRSAFRQYISSLKVTELAWDDDYWNDKGFRPVWKYPVQKSATANKSIVVAQNEESITINDFSAVHYTRGNIAYRRNALTEAIKEYTLAINLKPGHVDAYFHRSMAHYKKGEYDRVIGDCSKVIGLLEGAPLPPHFSSRARIIPYIVFYTRGLAYEKKGKSDKAIVDFSLAIRLKQDFESAYLARARVYESNGEQSKAAADSQKVKELRALKSSESER